MRIRSGLLTGALLGTLALGLAVAAPTARDPVSRDGAAEVRLPGVTPVPGQERPAARHDAYLVAARMGWAIG